MPIPERSPAARSGQRRLKKMDSNLEKLAVFWWRQVSPDRMALAITVGVGGLIGCALLLGGLEYLLTRGFTQPLHLAEIQTLQWIHQFANSRLDRLMLFVTRLCNPEVAVPVALLTLGALLARQARLAAWIFAIAGLGSILLNRSLKPLLPRLRPALYLPLIQENTFSFPSAHALGSTVLYGMIAYLLAIRYPQRAIWIYLLTAILVAVVGFSRLYLGVHWPTDVLAGWGVGFLWLITCITMLRLQQLEYERGEAK
jgi:membrane-associated phospholipid phosphatase